MKKLYIMKLKSLILMILVFFLFNIGCVDLTEKPLDFPSPENFFQTETQIISALTGSMGALYSKWGDYSYGWGGFHEPANRDAELVFQASFNNWIWRAHYRAIAILNSVIKALNEDRLGPTVPQETKDQLMAQAKFLRGFNYFRLVRSYGDVPIITEETDLVNGEIKRQPIREVYDQILADLNVALSGLPEEWPADQAGRPSKDAARAMLAKVYLTMATAPLKETQYFQNARDMAKQVMDNGVHYLVHDVDKVFSLETQLGPEYIFGFNATSDDIATPPQIWLPGSMAFGWGDFGIDRTWTLKYPNQPRKAAYMILVDWNGDSLVSGDNRSWWGGAAVRKYIVDPRDVLEKLNSTANVPLLRYADVLLMFAEADNMVHGGPTQEAVDAVNQIIDRANGYEDNPDYPRVTTAMSQDEFDAAVIKERMNELFFEYDTWYDLIRKEILCDVWDDRPAVKPNCDPNDYLWPIPQTDLRLNPLMEQNPGYPSP